MLMQDIEKGRKDIDIKLGMNVHSIEWIWFYDKMTSKSGGKNIICGDFERWDKSMLLKFAFFIGRWMAKMMGFSPDSKEYFMTLRAVRAAFHAVHYNPIGVYRTRMGGTSGHWWTSLINSIYNSVIHRLAFNCLCPHLKWKFDTYVALGVYGDDSAGDVHNDVAGLYNMQTLSSFFLEKLGMIYTSPSKGKVDRAFFTIDEASFLKRSFGKMVVDGKVYITAQLDKDSIHNCIHWETRERNEIKRWQNLTMMCNAYLMEYFKYGPEQFEYARRRLLDKMNRLAKKHKMPNYYYESFTEHFQTWLLEHAE
jgi:hypothetical protein